MSYIVKVTKKIFSKSAQRIIEKNNFYEFQGREKAENAAKAFLRNPMVTSAIIFKEDVIDGE